MHNFAAVLIERNAIIFNAVSKSDQNIILKYFLVSRKWRSVRSKPGPGCLHSHCAVKFLSVMMLFAGERDGEALNEMWRFHFGKH
jgi:hypothetical protein